MQYRVLIYAMEKIIDADNELDAIEQGAIIAQENVSVTRID